MATLGVALAAPAAQSSHPDNAAAQIAKKCKKKHRRNFFARFCVSQTTFLEEDYSGGGGADAIWCFRSIGPI